MSNSDFDCVAAYTEKLLVQMDPGAYFFINQGCLTVDNMDDKAEMQCVEVSIVARVDLIMLLLSLLIVYL